MNKLDEKVIITKGNIPIDNNLLNKYPTAEAMFFHEKSKTTSQIVVPNDIKECLYVDLKNMNVKDLKLLAYKIYCDHHNKNYFFNDNNLINVSHLGINESIEKIYFNRIQREYLTEHLKVFSCLGKIIENAKLINQVLERKGRVRYNSWNYYFDGLEIDGKKFFIEFEVVSLINGKNNYRIQRLEPK